MIEEALGKTRDEFVGLLVSQNRSREFAEKLLWKYRHKIEIHKGRFRAVEPDEEPGEKDGRRRKKERTKLSPKRTCVRCGREKDRLKYFPRGSKFCHTCRPRRLMLDAERKRRLRELREKHARHIAILRGEA